MEIHIINGPNLNLLGTREPEKYGKQSFESFFTTLKEKYSSVNLHYYQSNIEGEIINYIQLHGGIANGLIINPAAYAHTSIAIADAITAVNAKVVEVHISNIYNREMYRHNCITASVSIGVISGLGLKGYELALQYFM